MRLYISIQSLERALLGARCFLPTARELYAVRLGARIRRAFRVCE